MRAWARCSTGRNATLKESDAQRAGCVWRGAGGCGQRGPLVPIFPSLASAQKVERGHLKEDGYVWRSLEGWEEDFSC